MELTGIRKVKVILTMHKEYNMMVLNAAVFCIVMMD